MNTREADAIARRLWDTGRAIRSLGGYVLMGPVDSEGRFVAYYTGKSWSTVVRRAMTNKPYDGPDNTLKGA
jgi:hypothetical protein